MNDLSGNGLSGNGLSGNGLSGTVPAWDATAALGGYRAFIEDFDRLGLLEDLHVATCARLPHLCRGLCSPLPLSALRQALAHICTGTEGRGPPAMGRA